MKQILAAFSFFTRLPFWRLADIPKECYERVVPLWPMVGWLTGGLMYLTFCGGSYVLPTGVCVMLALLVRVLVTGALHEDGFADFCDGFGGGTTRERTLEIMKDSHIGTYGVLGLIIYYLLISNLLCDLISQSISLFIIVADTFCKYLASTIIYSLPYARKENEAKNKLIYSQVSLSEKCFSFLIGIMPFLCVLTLVLCGHMELINIMTLFIAMLVSVITSRILFRFMHIRIKGYTGDCCGATFIILETVFYLTVVCTNSILTNP